MSREVAEAFGAEPELVPLLPELLADFEDLGGWPDKVVAALGESADLPSGAAVVDLGCGKGAISIAIARELGHRVTGVDLFRPFIDDAVAASRAAGVDHLCSFEEADIREVVSRMDVYEAAVLTSVGPGLFGDHAACIGAIRRCVRPGGFMVVGDGFLRQHSGAMPRGYEYYADHGETIRQLCAHGDAVVREILVSHEEQTLQNQLYLDRIRNRARGLSETHPGHREQLERYLAMQEVECDFLDGVTAEAIWLLRRA